MLKIWNMKKDAAAEGTPSHPASKAVTNEILATKKPKISAAQIRVQKGEVRVGRITDL